jgi:DNA helicase-2/ATP-dependent DNA helicase PcrA
MLNSGIKVNNHGDLEEERRLLYVAITRAKEELYITIPQQYHNNPTKVSRFLEPFF